MPSIQYVTLVATGGTPIRLADQSGAPYPTTGFGSLVFSDEPTINSPIFTGTTTIASGNLQLAAGTALAPILAIGTATDGLYSSGAGNIDVTTAGVRRLAVSAAGINVVGDVTYSGVLVGAYASPLTTRGDFYYRGVSGVTRLPLGANGTVLGSNGTDATWVVAGAGTVSSITASTGLTATPNPIVGVGTIALADTAVVAGIYGSATQAPQITVDAQGRLTSATSLVITPAVGSITGLGSGVATALAINVGSAGALITFNGNAGTPSALVLTNATGTPTSIGLANGTGLPLATGISGFGTGIATALAINTGSAGAPVLLNGAGGTPSSLTLSNAAGLPIATGISGLGTGIAAALAINTGSAGAPVLFNGALGTPTSGSVANLSGFPTATAATTFLTGANVTVNTTLTAVCNTGSIGASGQVWLIMGTLCGFLNSGATVLTADIFNGSAVVASGANTPAASNYEGTVSLSVVVTLSAPTTFSLRGGGNTAGTVVLRAALSSQATADKMTCITAIRLA